MADASEVKSKPRPQLGWKLPSGWKEAAANDISLANFIVPGSEGREAQLSITQLANLSGRDAMIVNMWRAQAGLGELSDEEALKQFQPVQIGTEQGNLFEVSGKAKSGISMRILTAFVHHPDGSWFYRLSGDSALVAEQKPIFIEFLKSIQIKEAAPGQPEAAVASEFNWSVPAQWKTVAPGQMQVARFAVPNQGSAKAEVFVSVFPSDTGGTLANVNRWRKQIGLGPVEEKDLASLVAPLDPANPEAILVDMANNGKRLVGAVVARDGRYWFYKLIGDDTAVTPEKASLIAFAKSKP
ncbi:MAG: hypothetical protein JWR19_2333 [Pedosphaera sp.]|nr:hypothetical protein [Pedosphaera sp.]